MDKRKIGECDEVIQEGKGKQNIEQLKDKNISFGKNVLAEVLKENMQNKEKDKQRIKMEKQIQAKDELCIDLKSKNDRLQKQLLKANQMSRKLMKENAQFITDKQNLKKELSNYLIKQKQALSKYSFSKMSEERLQEQIIKLQKQNTELKNATIILKKQQQIAMRRIRNESKQKTQTLQGKLQIKQKQKQKVEQFTNKNKQQYLKNINQKDNQIQQLNQQISQLTLTINQLKQTLATTQSNISIMQQKSIQLQNAYEQELNKFNKAIQQYKNTINIQANKYNSTIQLIKTCLQLFTPAIMQNNNDEPIKIVQTLKQNISQTKQKIQFFQVKHEENSKVIQNQKFEIIKLNNTIKITQQQIKHIKNLRQQNTKFANVIKQHLQTQQQKYQHQNHRKIACLTMKKQIINQNQKRQKQKKKDTLINNKQLINTLQGNYVLKNANKQRQSAKKVDKKSIIENTFVLSDTKIQDCTKAATHQSGSNNCHREVKIHHNQYMSAHNFNETQSEKSKSQYQLIKEELAHRKKSLIYIMYNQQSRNVPDWSNLKQKSVSQNKKTTKKRSSSMIDLVRQKCQQQVM